MLKKMLLVAACASVFIPSVISASDANVIQSIQGRLEKLKSFFQKEGGDLNTVFNELNGFDNAHDEQPSQALDVKSGLAADDGYLVCVREGKIVVHTEPSYISKDSSTLKDASGNELATTIVNQLKAASGDKASGYYHYDTGVQNPADNAKNLSEKRVYVAWGRKALLGERLDRDVHGKLMCFISKVAA